jgi:hypothetical protein
MGALSQIRWELCLKFESLDFNTRGWRDIIEDDRGSEDYKGAQI